MTPRLPRGAPGQQGNPATGDGRRPPPGGIHAHPPAAEGGSAERRAAGIPPIGWSRGSTPHRPHPSNPAVGDLAANHEPARRVDPPRRRPRRRTSVHLHRDVPDRIPRRGPRAAHLVRGRRRVAEAKGGRATAGRGRDSARSPWWSATWTGGRSSPRASASPRAAPLDAAALLHRGQVVVKEPPSATCRTTASSTSTATSSRGDRLADLPAARRRRGDRGLRGPVGRRAAPSRWGGRGRSRAARGAANASPYEKEKDDVRLGAGGQGAPARPDAPSPTSTRSAARTSWSSTETRWSSPPPASWSRAQGGKHRRSCSITDLELPEAGYGGLGTFQVDAGDGRRDHGGERLELSARPRRAVRAAGPRDRRSTSTTPPRSTRRWSSRSATSTAAKNGFQFGHPRPVRRHRLGADRHDHDQVLVVLMPSRYSSDHSVERDAQELVDRQGITPGTVPIAEDDQRLREGDRDSPAWPRRTSRPGCAAVFDLMGPVQRARPPRPHHRQQERAGHRLLHPLRRLRGRLRPHQGRAQDLRLGAVALAQRPGGRSGEFLRRVRGAADPGGARWRKEPAARSSAPTSATPTPCPRYGGRQAGRLRREGHGLRRTRRRRARPGPGRQGDPPGRPHQGQGATNAGPEEIPPPRTSAATAASPSPTAAARPPT